MKKILCILMAVISLAIFVFPVSAASVTMDSDIMKDLSGITVDGKLFAVENFPVDRTNKSIEILSFVECNYNSKSNSPDFAIYVSS